MVTTGSTVLRIEARVAPIRSMPAKNVAIAKMVEKTTTPAITAQVAPENANCSELSTRPNSRKLSAANA